MPGPDPTSPDPTSPDPTNPSRVTRRSALAATAVLAAAPLAACGSGSVAVSGPASGPASGPGSGPGSGQAGSTQGGSTVRASPSGAARAPAPGTVLAKLDALPVGSALVVTGPHGAPLVLARPGEHEVRAFSAACTHSGCPVAVAGTVLRCPCHRSRFDALTGAVLSGPAVPFGNLPSHATRPAIPAVTISGTDVVTA
jgi:Rieske Fe-S protein